MKSISENARIGADVLIGEFTVIEKNVEIGEGTIVGHHVIIREGSFIGPKVRIDDHACIGKQPMRSIASAVSTSDHQAPCRIGEGSIVGTGAIIYANATIGEAVLVADHATVRENVVIGSRTIVGRGVAIENCCKIGSRCKLETNAYITAYSTVEDDCFIAPGVVTSNDNYAGRDSDRHQFFKGVTIRKGGRIGAQATILPGKDIGADALVAAGSVVTHDVPDETVVKGNPARTMMPVPDKQLLRNQ